MKKIITNFLFVGLLQLTSWAQSNKSNDVGCYYLKLNLNEVINDKLKVEMVLPFQTKETVEFHIPKMVPGTYSIENFGRFVSAFAAFDVNGKELDVIRLDSNRWEIHNAQKLQKITYFVDDTFDGEAGKSIFEPAGSSIEENKSFLLNNFAFFGYLNGMKDIPFQLKINHPENLFGASALDKKITSSSIDTYYAPNYFELHDSPIFYSLPDTTSIIIANAKIMVAVNSPNKKITSSFVMENVKDVLNATANYLGGTLPVDRYTILIDLLDGASNSGGFGALEHAYSTMFVLPESQPEYLVQTIRDVTAHEFLHIVTPLSIHAEEISNFDFINPKMSEHLWLYEGCTEYTAQLIQVREGIMTVQDFINVITQKMNNADGYKKNISFTDMSKNVLVEYKEQYNNVYEKGALIGMCLDLKLRNEFDGEYGLKNLLDDLAKSYGKEKPFQDSILFSKIGELTSPSIKNFLVRYVEGREELPFEEILALAGIQYYSEYKEMALSLGEFTPGFNDSTSRIVILDNGNMDVFGKQVGFLKGDEIVSWAGKSMIGPAIEESLAFFKGNTKSGDKFIIELARKGKKGKYKIKKIQAIAFAKENIYKNVLLPFENLTDKQIKVRKGWIKY
jgi:predicted metalloprotease with PDZ domain